MWSETEENLLRELYPKNTATQIANQLHRTPHAIRRKVVKLGLKKQMNAETMKSIANLAQTTNFSYAQIAKQIGTTDVTVLRVLHRQGIRRRPSGPKSTFPSLHGFKYGSHSGASDTRHALLHVYQNTCWDCKRAFINEVDLHIHHDFSRLPVQAIVLCRDCHAKRHNKKSIG